MIKNEHNRGKLCEGRNFGFGFSILDKTGDDFQALMAFTACKDYLNDFVYIETTNKPLESIFGFKHEYTGVFVDKEYFYLGINCLHYNNNSGNWPEFAQAAKELEKNKLNLILFLRKLESFFELQNRTTFETFVDGTLVLKVPIFWSKYSFLISLYTLYIRCFCNITDEEVKKELKDIINTNPKFLIVGDNMLFQQTKKLFNDGMREKVLDYKYPDEVQHMIHNFGIGGRLMKL